MFIEGIYGKVENFVLGGQNWAENVPLKNRWEFYQKTGVILGTCRKETTEMIIGADIRAELRDGKLFCAENKLDIARRVGLKIDLS